MRLYISGAITNNPNYKEDFAKTEKYLKEIGFETVNPVRINCQLPESTKYEEYMTMCFAMIDICDGIWVMPNYINSAGAKREIEYAKSNGKKILNMIQRGIQDGN